MNIKKIIALASLLLCFVTLISFISTRSTHAISYSDIFHIKIEASTDNGASWHNYDDNESAGGETISANPGDTIKFRIKAWDSELAVEHTIGSFAITNSDHIESISGIETNVDEDPVSYLTDFFNINGYTDQEIFDFSSTMAGSGDESYCTPGGGAEGPCELTNFNLKLKDNFPAGETILTLRASITGFNSLITYNPQNKFALIEKAKAADFTFDTVYSVVRISVNNPISVQDLPGTGAD